MKISAEHLDAVRALLMKATSQLSDQTRVARAAADLQLNYEGEVRILQGAFDICAAGYAQDTELSSSQLDGLPQSVQAALGYSKPVPA